MSRLPLRHLYRLVHSALEKAALACAAFGLLHATAEADERRPVEVSLADPWRNPAVQPSPIDDAWGPYASRDVQPDDAWTASLANRAGPGEPGVAIAPMTAPLATPSMLVNDRPDWNDIPRARSPGLIAANDAWRSRVVDGADWNNPPVKAAEPTPVEAPGKASSADPWLAPHPGVAAAPSPGADTQWEVAVKPSLRGSANTSTRSQTQAAPPIQGDARKADWSVFAGSARLNAEQQDTSVASQDASRLQNPTKASLHVAMNDFVVVRGRLAMTRDGRWYPLFPETSAPAR
jgi:hypothetical protein